jgi:hypothetical protein
MNEQLNSDIRRLIEANGAMGVNQLAKALNMPLSTMQKYLDKQQTYFKKNHARKWVLPEMSVSADMSHVSESYGSIIDSQLSSMNVLIETLMSQFRATVTLLESNKGNAPSVAAPVLDVHPQMAKADKNIKDTYIVFKKYVGKCPEEYRDLLKNVDLYRLSLEMGSIYLNGVFNDEITDLFLERGYVLSEEVISVLKTYQKMV